VGLFPARLLKGIPTRLAGGTYTSREVCFEGLPSISVEDVERRGGPLQAQRGNPSLGHSRPQGNPDAPVATSPSFAEDKEVTPVVSDEPVKAEARLIAATNRDIPELLRTRPFCRALYERLKVVVVKLSPLRERREDIRPLAEGFLALWNAQYGERRFLTNDALALLEAYSWPGNVRELQNALRSAACSSTSEALGPEALPEEISSLRQGLTQLEFGCTMVRKS
jgi:hypothetical protein